MYTGIGYAKKDNVKVHTEVYKEEQFTSLLSRYYAIKTFGSLSGLGEYIASKILTSHKIWIPKPYDTVILHLY